MATKTSKTSKTSNQNAAAQNAAELLATFAPEEIETLAKFAAIFAGKQNAQPEEKASDPQPETKAKLPRGIVGAWCTFIYNGKPYMGKAYKVGSVSHFNADGAKVRACDCSQVTKHADKGTTMKALNAMRRAAKETPKEESTDIDERAARVDKRNAAIIASIPLDKDGSDTTRKGVQAKLNAAHSAGYRYARLAKNKEHQLDGLHLYCGSKGHGSDPEFIALESKRAAAYRAKADKARADGKERGDLPKRPAGLFIWSPVGGGNLYARGIFGAIKD